MKKFNEILLEGSFNGFTIDDKYIKDSLEGWKKTGKIGKNLKVFRSQQAIVIVGDKAAFIAYTISNDQLIGQIAKPEKI